MGSQKSDERINQLLEKLDEIERERKELEEKLQKKHATAKVQIAEAVRLSKS